MVDKVPPVVAPADTGWKHHHRLVASKYPPVSLFEDYVDAELLNAAFQIESRTNARLRAEAGDLSIVPREDYVLGAGASPVMAAFTHYGHPSRFTDGAFGVYYAARSRDTAVAEVRFHRTRFLKHTSEPSLQMTLRCYVGTIQKPLFDIRSDQKYAEYLNPDIDTYPHPQKFSAHLRSTKAWGLLYPSVRHAGGECVAFYRPPAVGIPAQGKHIIFYWNGEKISEVFEATELI